MTKETLIFGHKNPDTDSITSALVMENLEKKLGNENAKAVRLGNVNKETQYVLKYLGIEAPELIKDVEDNQDVILVDHNEASQTVENISNAKILKVVDHHTMNFVAPYQLYYRAEPVGCTATVLYKMYKENDVEIDKTMATLMLSAIASDTLILKSPTTTEDDKKIVKKLEEISGLDINVYGTDMLKAGTDISEFTPEEIINIDCKLFEKGNKKFRIAQVNTADLDSIFKNQSYFEQAIAKDIEKENLDLWDIRLLSATNKNIQDMVDSGTFREDLLYRLNTIHLEIPPLRERREDIHLFIDYFMQRYAAKYEKKEIFLHEHALEKLCSYHWPGNIRELQHTIEKAVILCEGDVIRSKDIFVKQTWSPQFSTTVPNLEEVERQAIETAIRQNDGNLTATAEQLGISRQTLYNKIKRFKL